MPREFSFEGTGIGQPSLDHGGSSQPNYYTGRSFQDILRSSRARVGVKAKFDWTGAGQWLKSTAWIVMADDLLIARHDRRSLVGERTLQPSGARR